MGGAQAGTEAGAGGGRDPGGAPLPLEEAGRIARAIQANVEKVIEGKTEAVRLAVATLIARGHALLEDVPGVGKTTLAKSLARSIRCGFGRVQATSDLLPSDVVGITVLDPGTSEFRFHRGPIFTHVLLVDEINRATPRTQSCLLEAMAERQVTVDRETYRLEDPFFVIATQNPAEQVGTYFLPESQMDRFAVRIQIGYPSPESELAVLRQRDQGRDPLSGLEPVCDAGEVIRLQAAAGKVRMAESVQRYLLQIVARTRDQKGVLTGVSTRGALVYQAMAQALALMEGRDHVLPDDVKSLAVPVLSHRLLLASRLRSLRADQEETIQRILDEVRSP